MHLLLHVDECDYPDCFYCLFMNLIVYMNLRVKDGCLTVTMPSNHSLLSGVTAVFPRYTFYKCSYLRYTCSTVESSFHA